MIRPKLMKFTIVSNKTYKPTKKRDQVVKISCKKILVAFAIK